MRLGIAFVGDPALESLGTQGRQSLRFWPARLVPTRALPITTGAAHDPASPTRKPGTRHTTVRVPQHQHRLQTRPLTGHDARTGRPTHWMPDWGSRRSTCGIADRGQVQHRSRCCGATQWDGPGSPRPIPLLSAVRRGTAMCTFPTRMCRRGRSLTSRFLTGSPNRRFCRPR